MLAIGEHWIPTKRSLRSSGALVPRPRRLRPLKIDCDLVSECWWRAKRTISLTPGELGHAYIDNIEPFRLEKEKRDMSGRGSSTRATIGESECLLTIAGVGHVRVVAVDACASTGHELRGVCMGGKHRAMVGVGEAVDVLQ